MIIFETPRLIVRSYTINDQNNFFLLNGDEEVMRYIRTPKSKAECDAFLLDVIQSEKENPLFGRWAADEKLTGDFVGSFAVIPVEQSDKMQLGYALLKDSWGKGFATELTMGGLQYIFEKTQLPEIYAIAESGNDASQKVLLKSGFLQESIFSEGQKKLLRFIFKKPSQNFASTPV
jgi:ribosomal-protein-alanine N-acetyltransferase